METFDLSNNVNGGRNERLLSREEMEAMLPDYSFGSLSDAEREAFERSLRAYPDLTQEIRDIQDAFELIDAEALNRGYAQRLKNLSIRVQERLERDFVQTLRRRRFFRLIMPALVAACIVAVVALPQGVLNMVWSDSAVLANSDLIRPEEAQLILDDESLADGVSEIDIAFIDRTVIDSRNPDIDAKEALLAARLIDPETLEALSAAGSDALGDEMALLQDIDDDDVNESDVQTLLTEML